MKTKWIAIALLSMIAFVGFGASGAMAMGVKDVPEAFGNLLGLDSSTAGIILAAMVTISVALAVGQAFNKSANPLIPQVIVILATLGAMTAIGWVGIWLMFIAIIAFASLFTKKIVDTYNSSGSGD
jgi:hypothetical protein